MVFRLHLFPDLTLLVISYLALLQLDWWLWKSAQGLRHRGLLISANIVLGSVATLGYLLAFNRVSRHFPMPLATWLDAAGLILAGGLAATVAGAFVWRRAPSFQPGRRAFVKATGVTLMAAPYVVTGVGAAARNHCRLNTVDVPIPNLHPDLRELRIVQITDIHLSPFLSEREFARTIDMANDVKPHLTLVTGDLITRPGDPLEGCLRQLARLRADAGVLGCLGNHETYCQIEDYVTERGRRMGIDFLRRRSRILQFGNAKLNFAGVDYQRFDRPYLVGVDALVEPGMTNILLSHNPDVFPVAAAQGYDLTIAGHTHGGQINIEIVNEELNPARAFTPYVKGLYRHGRSTAYVSTGIGTIGIPVRIGAPAEVAVLRLCAS